jgi:hypothetical protein
MSSHASTNSPLTRPAIQALAKPAPMLAATSNTVTALSNGRWLPSGSVITGMIYPYSGDTHQVSLVDIEVK